MAVHIEPERTRRITRRGLLLVLLLGSMALALAGCGLAEKQAGGPTLVPTLALAMPEAATPLPSVMPAALTATPPADTPAPAATETQAPVVENTITPGPSPTITRTPTITRIPTRTKSPTRTPTITLTPTMTPTATPPSPDLDLVRPGLMSKVLSPIQAELYAVSGGDARVTVELIGEDGRVITSQVEDYQRPNRYVWLAPKIPFEISAPAEAARLQVVTRDEFGRLEGVISTDLILLSVGRSEINPPAITQEPYLIRMPQKGAQVFGGVLSIVGLARPVNDSPLIIELVAENGDVIAHQQLQVALPTGDVSHTPFNLQIPYKVDGPTSVRLTLRQEGSRIPGTVALVSRIVLLNP